MFGNSEKTQVQECRGSDRRENSGWELTVKDMVFKVWIQSVDGDEGPSVSFCLLLSCFYGEERVPSCPPIPFTLLAGSAFIRGR